MHWLGGMGIVVLAVALLPMLGVGGMQLMRAETPGPIKDSKLTPRITGTAKALWPHLPRDHGRLRRSRTGSPGMTPFDAIAHSFSTVSTGGISTHDANLGFFDNEVIEGIAVVLHVPRRRELLAALPGVAPQAPRQLLPRSRVPRLFLGCWRWPSRSTSQCCG